ncbi:MAG: hypothetical protein ABI823_20310, partial [Bryobacteraceae bacterium]
MRTLLLLLVLAASAFAQIEGPRLGLVVDGENIATVWGVPGVAVTAPLRTASARLTVASPKQDYLLGVPADGPGLLILSNSGRESADRLVLPETVGIDAILFSPRGDTVALRRGAVVDILAGLPQRADVVRSFDLSFAGDAPARISVADDGSAILAVLPGGDVFRLDANGLSRIPTDGVLAASFFPRSRDAALAYAEKIVVMRDNQSPLEFPAPGISAASVFATPRFVAAFDKDFFVVDIASGHSTRLAPDGEVRSLQAAGDVIFFLTADGWSALDLTESEP